MVGFGSWYHSQCLTRSQKREFLPPEVGGTLGWKSSPISQCSRPCVPAIHIYGCFCNQSENSCRVGGTRLASQRCERGRWCAGRVERVCFQACLFFGRVHQPTGFIHPRPHYFSITLSQYCEGLVEVLLLGKLAEEEPKRV